ncbi:hypothetical protein N1030_11585 [Desulfovibrio mangrovi]|uniref:hypothetical protein n=1 Tax=Desulfovibrio mangrovi TaxID=2976983 RepID=UPI002247EDBD|nr:hypothetical protein [Desulfovibrio mangrovi]UZP66256.1 hypothetical protein N1030_11585 [Desulfovibrio mangrovi]
MERENRHLYDFVDPTVSDDVLGETVHIAVLLGVGEVESELAAVHADVVRLFGGAYPGFRRSTAKYHNLEHTSSVVLATARLLHGCVLAGVTQVSPRGFMLCVLAAYFHDVGLIQEEGDTDGTGAKYTVGHEERSIAFMRTYLGARGYAEADLLDCADMIRCTILAASPDDVVFSSEEISVLGRIIGTADLVAQIADRTYLEKLRLLFLEFEEAKLPGFTSELELIMKTEAFYTNVAKRRLEGSLLGLNVHMRRHFRERWGLDDDLYQKAIDGNISYISELAERCRTNPRCYEKMLRRDIPQEG